MKIAPPQLFRRTFLEAKQVQDLNRKKILSLLEKYHFVCIRGLISPQEIEVARGKLRENFDPLLDHPSVGEKPEQVMGTFQKLSLGTQVQAKREGRPADGKINYELPRFLRILYTPFWERDSFGLHPLFRRLCQVRNLLYDLPSDFCIDRSEKGLWTAARIHQFPAGGGFFSSHRDGVQSRVARKKGLLSYYQPVLIMSKKGEDFERGGGFFEFQGKRFYLEEHCEPGDIGIYDGLTVHGVDPVDPHKSLDLQNFGGRMAGFVSLYKDLSRAS